MIYTVFPINGDEYEQISRTQDFETYQEALEFAKELEEDGIHSVISSPN